MKGIMLTFKGKEFIEDVGVIEIIRGALNIVINERE